VLGKFFRGLTSSLQQSKTLDFTDPGRLVLARDTALMLKAVKKQISSVAADNYKGNIFLDAIAAALVERQTNDVRKLSYNQRRLLAIIAVGCFETGESRKNLPSDVTLDELQAVESVRQKVKALESNAKVQRYGSRKNLAVEQILELADGELKSWLVKRGPDPDLWHDVVFLSFRDLDIDAYEWIVNQSKCDAATALMIFHLFNSVESMRFRDENMANESGVIDAAKFRIAQTICERWDKKSFESYKLKFWRMGYEIGEDVYSRAVQQAIDRFGSAPFVPAEAFFEYQVDVDRR
jgi:succinate dehydrogenase flavin-adding protein (antitoxin of CptAB toxin-antitoxin module)